MITGVYLARASQRLCELSGSSVAGASAVPVQMWAGASAVPVQMWAAVHVEAVRASEPSCAGHVTSEPSSLYRRSRQSLLQYSKLQYSKL